ncbi:MAG: efflux RND transporter periplasmic adaptor subunit [Bauldia sp.]
MASAIFKPSRIIAVLLVLGAGAWIGSGLLLPHEGEQSAETATAAASTPAAEEMPQVPLQKVAVTTAIAQRHERQVLLSCVTEADQRAIASARGAGVVTELKVKRGSIVKSGDTIATISDEGRMASVAQAKAVLEQRKAEYNAKKRLIDRGDQPRNDLPVIEAAVAAAEAVFAAAEAEEQKMMVRSPVDGMVDKVPIQVGQAVMAGSDVAEVIGPDPMLAVGAVSEARRGWLKPGQLASVRFIDNASVEGKISFIGLSGDKSTRTYRVEATMTNPNAQIPDGVSCEMAVSLEPVEATSVPRSALVFSDAGVLGVRVADGKSQVQFKAVQLVDDGRENVWVTGLDSSSRVIVVGQDFVKEGDAVEAVSAAQAEAKPVPPA